MFRRRSRSASIALFAGLATLSLGACHHRARRVQHRSGDGASTGLRKRYAMKRGRDKEDTQKQNDCRDSATLHKDLSKDNHRAPITRRGSADSAAVAISADRESDTLRRDLGKRLLNR